MSTELTKHESGLEVQERSLMEIIANAAVDPRVDVDKLERLLAMKERVMADQRKTVFISALGRLQAEVPQINKYGQGKNSKFAKLEDIDVVVRPLMARYGFSISFDEESHTEKDVTFVMVLAHEDGHSESKRLTVPVDQAAKNREGNAVRPAIQDAGSTVSYARRYLMKMHLNIIETDEDTDGESRKKISEEQARDLVAAIEELSMDKGRFLVFMGVGDVNDIRATDLKKALNAIETKRNDNARKAQK